MNEDDPLAALLSPVQLSSQRNIIAALVLNSITNKRTFPAGLQTGDLKQAFAVTDQLIEYGKAYPQGHFGPAP